MILNEFEGLRGGQGEFASRKSKPIIAYGYCLSRIILSALGSVSWQNRCWGCCRKKVQSQWLRRSAGLGPVSEAKAGTKGTKRAVTGDKGEAAGEGMSGHKHVHGGEGTAFLPGGGAQVRVGLCGRRVPREDGNAQQELIDELGEFCGLGFQGKTEEQFGFGVGRNADLGEWDEAQMLANRRRISLEGIADTIGIEHETEHARSRSEKTAFFCRPA